MPSDDELRGTHTPSKGGSGANGGLGGGNFGGGTGGQSGGAGGSAGSAGGGKCSVASDWTATNVPSPAGVSQPRIVGTTNGDVALGFMSGKNAFAQFVQAGTPQSAVQLSNSGSASEIRIAWSSGANALGAVWMDPQLDFASITPSGSKQGKYVYSAITDPEGKKPQHADIASSGSAFAIVFNAYADCAQRLYGVIVDDGGNQTGALYTRLTDDPFCSWSANMNLISTGTGDYSLVWADNRSQCQPTGGGCNPPHPEKPMGSPWSPQVFWLKGDISVNVGQSAQAPVTTANGSDYPAIAWDGTETGAAWLGNSGGTRTISFSIAGPGATPTELSTDAPADGVSPSVAAGAKGFGVAWQSGGSVYFAAVDSAGKKRFDVNIASSAASGDAATIAWNGSEFVIAYTDAGQSQIKLMTCAP